MGSLEVFDYKQQKWVPLNPDPEEAYRHFKDLRDGLVFPDHKGRYFIGSGKNRRSSAPVVNLVSPVVVGTEIARSEVARKNNEDKVTKIRKNPKRPLKRKYTPYNPNYSV